MSHLQSEGLSRRPRLQTIMAARFHSLCTTLSDSSGLNTSRFHRGRGLNTSRFRRGRFVGGGVSGVGDRVLGAGGANTIYWRLDFQAEYWLSLWKALMCRSRQNRHNGLKRPWSYVQPGKFMTCPGSWTVLQAQQTFHGNGPIGNSMYSIWSERGTSIPFWNKRWLFIGMVVEQSKEMTRPLQHMEWQVRLVGGLQSSFGFSWV